MQLTLLPFLTLSVISRIVAIYNNFTVGIRDLCLTSSLVLLCSGNCTVIIDPDRTDGILGFQMQVLAYIWKINRAVEDVNKPFSHFPLDLSSNLETFCSNLEIFKVICNQFRLKTNNERMQFIVSHSSFTGIVLLNFTVLLRFTKSIYGSNYF